MPARRRLAAAGLLVVVSVAALWVYARSSSNTSFRSRDALVAAVGSARFVEGRLFGGFAYAALRSGTRTATPADDVSLLAAAGALQKQADADPSAINLSSLGVAQLLLGRHQQAVRDLRDALWLAPGDAHVYSDLAVAYLAKAAASGGDVEDFARAIDASERALTLDPAFVEARFNKALALERAGLTDEATEAWREYATTDPGSPWAHEARARMAGLKPSAGVRDRCLQMLADAPDRLADDAARCPQQAREHAERLFGAWADDTQRGRVDDAARSLGIIKRIATALAQSSGERLLADSLAAVERARRHHRALAVGHSLMERGRTLYDADRRDEAASAFREARTILRNAGSPYWLASQQALATVHTHRRELTEALVLLDEVAAKATEGRYLALAARVEWLRGVATLQQSDPSGALDHYRKAGELFERIGETGNVSNVANAAADTERILGDFARGWQSLTTGLRYVGSVGDPTRRYLLFYNTALFARREGLDCAALHYQRRALTVARERKGPVGIIEASINQSGVLGRLGRISEAEASLIESERMLDLLGDAQPRAYQRARIAATRGEFLLVSNPQQAVHQLDEALGYFATMEPSETPRLLLLKGTALARAGDQGRAMDTYVEGIDRFEDRLRRLRSDEQRVSYLDEGWELYRKLMELKLAANQQEEALALSDRGRSRAGSLDVTFSIQRLRSSLAPDQVLVHYTVLDQAVHAWVIRKDSSEHRKLGVSRRELEIYASQVLRAVGGRGSAAVLDSVLRALHQAVIAPLQLRSAREIIVVPDGVLRNVPFAALRGVNNRYLAEDSAIVVAASADELVSPDTRSASAAPPSHPELLAVGNPLVDRTRWSVLAPLPFAAGEATQVAAMYARATLLTGAQATKIRLIARLPSADVFHFAGHAVANEHFPELSRLLLTPTGEDGGELLARELRDAGLKRGSTVVLSACDTAVGPDRRAAGPQSLAQAFLTLGARTVVAAHWEVEDIDTSELMTAFHTGLSRGISPARALQAAQVGQIQAGKPVASWAAFAAFSRHLR